MITHFYLMCPIKYVSCSRSLDSPLATLKVNISIFLYFQNNKVVLSYCDYTSVK